MKTKTKYQIIIISILYIAICTTAFAQGSLSENRSNMGLDIRAAGYSMSLTKDIDEFPPLVIYDYKVVEMNDTLRVDLTTPSLITRSNLAAIIGVKPKQIKAYRILQGKESTQLWGTRGHNGVLDVISPSKYRQLKKHGDEGNYNIIDGD